MSSPRAVLHRCASLQFYFDYLSATMSNNKQRKAVIKNADMNDIMQQDAVDVASKALSDYSLDKVRYHHDQERRGAFVFKNSFPF